MKTADLIELTLSTRSKVKTKKIEASDFFTRLGFYLSEIIYDEYKSLLKISVYTPSAAVAKKAQVFYSSKKMKGFRFKSRSLEKKDWFTKWQDHYLVAPLGKRFAIVPLWEKEAYTGKKIPVFLDPQGAFGSGTHATTKLMVGCLESLKQPFESFLDIGTGTGILMVIAAYLGARDICGMDHDGMSVRAAKQNLKSNSILKMRVWKQDLFQFKAGERYDVVTANMISKTLLDAQKVIWNCVKQRGYLIVSGIHRKNFESFLKEFKNVKFRLVKTVKTRSWAAAIYKKI